MDKIQAERISNMERMLPLRDSKITYNYVDNTASLRESCAPTSDHLGRKCEHRFATVRMGYDY